MQKNSWTHTLVLMALLTVALVGRSSFAADNATLGNAAVIPPNTTDVRNPVALSVAPNLIPSATVIPASVPAVVPPPTLVASPVAKTVADKKMVEPKGKNLAKNASPVAPPPTLTASPVAKTVVDKKMVEPKGKNLAKNATKIKTKNSPSNPEHSAAVKSDDVLGNLYVYVDVDGVPHYAMQPLDEHYQLFVNAGPKMDKDIKLAVGAPEKNLSRLTSALNKNSGGYSDYGVFGVGSVSKATAGRLLGSASLARYEGTIHRYAKKHGVDASLVKAVMAAESGFNAGALSSKNAMGLMQVIPATGARYGVTPEQLFIPERNIEVGVRYLRDLSRMFKGQPELIAAAYNAGEGAVYKYNRRVPPYTETQNYVRKVMQYYEVYNNQSGKTPVFVAITAKSGRQKVKVGLDAETKLARDMRREMQRME